MATTLPLDLADLHADHAVGIAVVVVVVAYTAW